MEISNLVYSIQACTHLLRANGIKLWYLEGLRQETLDLSRSGDGQLVFLGQLVHT